MSRQEEKKIKKEVNTFIFKYQKEDVNKKLGKIIGNNFREYRKNFNKTQNYPETGYIPEFPITVSLELRNRCNLNCVMCYKKHHSQPEAQLDLDVLEKLMKECKENKLPSMILGLGSETLIYQDIDKAVDIIKKGEVMDIFFGTNGVLLNDEIIEKIIKNKISRVEISVDAASSETYNKVRRVPVFEKVEENINKLVEAKKIFKSDLPVIRLCFVVMDVNKHETQKFIDKWKDKADYIDFQRMVDFSKIDEPGEVDREIIKNSFCSAPFYSLNVWANGDVSPCCTFYGRRLVIGNIHNKTLKEIWNGSEMKKIREQIETKKFNPICQKCLYFRDKNLIDKNFNE